MSENDHPRLPLLLAGAFLAVVAGGIADLILDRPRHWLTPHVVFEVGLIALSLGLALYLWTNWYRTARSLGTAARALADRQADAEHWRRSAQRLLQGLGGAMDAQLAAWELTAAEREMAVLLLKGLGHKQIAARTGRSERTVRQHAVAVYRKSGLGGRAELAAFFLEGLTLPGGGGVQDLHPVSGGPGGPR